MLFLQGSNEVYLKTQNGMVLIVVDSSLLYFVVPFLTCNFDT